MRMAHTQGIIGEMQYSMYKVSEGQTQDNVAGKERVQESYQI